MSVMGVLDGIQKRLQPGCREAFESEVLRRWERVVSACSRNVNTLARGDEGERLALIDMLEVVFIEGYNSHAALAEAQDGT